MPPIYLANENFVRIMDEYRELVYGYWYDTPQNSDHVPVDYDWDQYRILDNAGHLQLFTARDGRDKLVGVSLYVVVNMTHHKGYKIADCDTLGTALAVRGQGIGRKLVIHAVNELPKLGVKEIMHHTRAVFGEQSLFTSLGFVHSSTMYSLKV